MCMTVFYILWASIEQRYNIKNNLGGWVSARTGSMIPSNPSAIALSGSTQIIPSASTNDRPGTSGGIEVQYSVAQSMNTLNRSTPFSRSHYEKNPNLKTTIQTALTNQQQSARRPSYRLGVHLI